jgi:hypothetical protein
MMTSYVPQPYPAAPSTGRMWLRRIGEFMLIALVGAGYLLYNWRDVVSWFHTFMQSLKPNF